MIIECTVEELDDVKNDYNFKYFTIRNGKAQYHLIHLPDNSAGLYYALREGYYGLEGKRALEPLTKIKCYVE